MAPEHGYSNGEVKTRLEVISKDVGFIRDSLVVAVTNLSHSIDKLTKQIEAFARYMEGLGKAITSLALTCQARTEAAKAQAEESRDKMPIKFVLICVGLFVLGVLGGEGLKYLHYLFPLMGQ